MSALPRPRRPAAAALIALAAAAAGPAARAQTPPAAPRLPTDAGRLLEETRPPPRPALPPADAPRVVEPPVRPTIAMPEGTAVTVSDFRITGNVSFPTEELRSLVEPWVGKRLDINGLNEAAGAITRRYQSAGHLLTYAYLPAQRVADGVIELAVLEGRLENVQIVTAQDVRLRDEVVQAHTDGLTTDPAAPRPLLQPEVERKLLLLNDIPGVTARAAFTPGSTTGAADMVVSVAEDEPLDLRIELDNHGSRSTGEYRAGISLQLHDLFGWGDNTLASALASNRGGLVSGTLAASVPLGGDGYRVGASLSRLTYQLAGSFRDLGAVGSADAFTLDASYPFVRTPEANLSLKAGYEFKRLHDDIQFANLSSNPRRDNLFELTLSFDRRDGWGGVAAGNLVATMGDLQLLDDGQRNADAQGLVTGRRYAKLGAQFVRQQSLSGPFSLYLRAAGQASGGNLDSSEKMSLTGPGGVRAYAPGDASVDQGGLVSVELRYAHDYTGGGFVWGLFHERAAGAVNRHPLSAAANDQRLAGSGLSVQWSGGDYGLSASVAWRSRRALGSDGGDSQPRIYLQMVVNP